MYTKQTSYTKKVFKYNVGLKTVGRIDHPNVKWLLTQIEKGNELILEITLSTILHAITVS